MKLEDIKSKLTTFKAQKRYDEKKLAATQTELRMTRRKLGQAKEARIILQKASVDTQKKLEYHISNLVTLAESSVFPEPYLFRAEFESKRNQTECDLYFERNGKKYQIFGSVGGGVVDIANFALRISYLSMKEGIRPIILLDEPFKNINDPTRNLHRKAAEMVKEVSRLSGFQMIIVSQIPELADIADRLFLVDKIGKISNLEVL